jgi:hypothetical protein
MNRLTNLIDKSQNVTIISSAILFAAIMLILFLRLVSAQPAATVSGVVVDANGPVAKATVRIRATENFTLTEVDGTFKLGSLAEGEQVELTAWVDGYYIAYTYITPTVENVTLTLRPYHTVDNPEYAWVSPISGTSDIACGNCHPMILPQWQNNAHGGAVDNARFFSLYNGTDLSGTQMTGAGYLNDFPNTAGVCASCHAPGAGIDGYLTTDMNVARSVITAGIHCDYCHKIGGVYLNPDTDSVYTNMPGTNSTRMLRPPEGDQIFFGPYDDIHDPDTKLPLISESAFCAPCHQFSFWGTPIYESYEEWLASPYAESGVTCQDCHMPPSGDTHFALPEAGGLAHPSETIPSHFQLGAADTGLLQETMELALEAREEGDLLRVTVTLTNAGAGHHVPTDFPGRQMVLLLEVIDENEIPLTLVNGTTIPEWGGEQAGLPGKVYAKLLRDINSGDFPVISYWKQSIIESDNRIPALESDISYYIFSMPDEGNDVQVSATLYLRRLFADQAKDKGWDMPDILMDEVSTRRQTTTHYNIYLPLMGIDY